MLHMICIKHKPYSIYWAIACFNRHDFEIFGQPFLICWDCTSRAPTVRNHNSICISWVFFTLISKPDINKFTNANLNVTLIEISRFLNPLLTLSYTCTVVSRPEQSGSGGGERLKSLSCELNPS